jgi:hypothetical protein
VGWGPADGWELLDHPLFQDPGARPSAAVTLYSLCPFNGDHFRTKGYLFTVSPEVVKGV